MEQSLHKLRTASFKWRNVDTTILGRTIIANSVLLSKILYRGSINVASKPLLESIKKAMEAFIWKKNFMTFKSPIAWNKMVQPRIKGGAGALDPSFAVEASWIRWIKRLMKQENVKDYPPWKAWMLRRIKAFKTRNSIYGTEWTETTRYEVEFEGKMINIENLTSKIVYQVYLAKSIEIRKF